MFLKLKINTNERIDGGEELFTEILVNMDQVQTVVPNRGSAGKSKLRFMEGHSLICGQSMDFILASLQGTLDNGYKAPEPKE